MLHLTNGDTTVTRLRATGLTGEILAWRDILHEGPVPTRLTLEAMSDVRARYLSSVGAGPFATLRRSFNARDDALRGARAVTLWFEHDLYDQLQLIQILATLTAQPETTADLICIDAFPGVEPFHGLGQLTPAQLATLWPGRQRVTPSHLATGTRAWKAFTAPDLAAVRALLASDLSALPFFRAAVERWLEEIPSAPDGLGRTERQILQAVGDGARTFNDVFLANQQRETAPFLGDQTLRARLDSLVNARTPLLTREPFALTPAGARIRAGEQNAITLNGIDRWCGGVHLMG